MGIVQGILSHKTGMIRAVRSFFMKRKMAPGIPEKSKKDWREYIMRQTDVTCPVCGTVNRNLYLWETNGWYECEYCGTIAREEASQGEGNAGSEEKAEKVLCQAV